MVGTKLLLILFGNENLWSFLLLNSMPYLLILYLLLNLLLNSYIFMFISDRPHRVIIFSINDKHNFNLIQFPFHFVLHHLFDFTIKLYISYMSQITSAILFICNKGDILVLTIFALYLAGAFHVIDSGYIGVYKRGGAMLNDWTEPGLRFMMPFITKVLFT